MQWELSAETSVLNIRRVFEVEHASDEPCESVAGKEIYAGINKWKQPTLFEQRDKWNICILGDLDAGRDVLFVSPLTSDTVLQFSLRIRTKEKGRQGLFFISLHV